MKELEEKLLELKSQNISYTDLEILDEINYQSKYYLEIELTEEEKEMIFEKVHRTWLKTEELTIYQIVTTAMDNLKDLANMSVWDLSDKTIERYFY